MVGESEMMGSELLRDPALGARLLPSHKGATAPLGAGEDVRVIESCHSIWLFDDAGKRFCRISRDAHSASTPLEWRTFDRLVLHPLSDAFVVFLDSSSTSMLRSWRHQDPCNRCGGEVTMEMSLEDLRILMEG